MIRIYLSPDYSKVPPHADNGGIRRVSEAMALHLPKFGVEVVHNPAEAHIICNHGSMLVERKGVPSVHVGHGLYWSRQPWGDNFMEVNEQVAESMKHAVAHTVPSEWVGRAVRRGGYWYPEVVYHGVDPKQFQKPKDHKNYVLWNKARADWVSDPSDVMRMASRLQEVKFMTTIGTHPTSNLEIIGTIPYEKMKQVVAEAGVYLATTRETFGIGTLEAMAAGVPIAGWDWGGQSEIIIPGVTGYLAPPGDYPALAECIQSCFAYREALSKNCIEDVLARWTWEPRIEQYADIFKRVYDKYYCEHPAVSIIVTAYKLDQFLPKCLESVSSQTFKDFECLVIDDAQLKSTQTIVEHYAKKDKRIRYLPTPNNFGLVGARNFGFANSKGLYIRHLDADDFLAENAIALEQNALYSDRTADIVYGHLEMIREDGSRNIGTDGDPIRGEWPPEKFNWYKQMAHLNQLPSCVMARREVYERSGGYRERMKRNEDAEFWCRVTSLGFRAKKVTQAVTYFHRDRQDSKGAQEWKTEGSEPDWTAWFPWRMGASDHRSAMSIFRQYGDAPRNPYLVPFGAQGKSPSRFWYIHDYAYPVVSIVVTCGPTHERYLLDALDSIQAQNFIDWECIVVNDTGKPWDADIMGAPWAKVVNMDSNKGAAAARNEGFKHTRGRFVVWMDADDFWLPWFLERMVLYSEYNSDAVIFSDFLMMDDEKTIKTYHYQDFDSSRVPFNMQYPGSSNLVPRQIAEKIQWDEKIPGMEDFDFQIATHDAGFCAHRVPELLFVYRTYSSTKRENDYNKIDSIRDYLDVKWEKYRKNGEKMCGCNQPKKPPSVKPKSSLSSSGNFTEETLSANIGAGKPDEMVTVEYVGPISETFSIRSKLAPAVNYRFGNNDNHRMKSVFLSDAEFLISIKGRQNEPLYRVVGTSLQEDDTRNPVDFLGTPITT
jgi:glycosyltransferase involved in cell wall biosynthesis